MVGSFILQTTCDCSLNLHSRLCNSFLVPDPVLEAMTVAVCLKSPNIKRSGRDHTAGGDIAAGLTAEIAIIHQGDHDHRIDADQGLEVQAYLFRWLVKIPEDSSQFS